MQGLNDEVFVWLLLGGSVLVSLKENSPFLFIHIRKGWECLSNSVRVRL